MEDILSWFALKNVPGVGNYLFKRLIDRFKSPESVFNASNENLIQISGVSPRVISAIRKREIPQWAKKELDLVMERGYKIVTMSDPSYPALLHQIPDPPPFLYVYGNLDNSITNIAVVGSRNATRYGIATTKRLCTDLASLKFTIASGMARGVDTAAHTGALMGKGKTIAVLGSGLEKVYPSENLGLFHKIAVNGAVISEFPLMAEPEAHNFPIRNRIISGISIGTVIVEAAKKSGSLITARLAAEQNREVFAVPGSINSFKSAGTHSLIKQGAKLVEHARDIVEEFSNLIGFDFETDGTKPKVSTNGSLSLEPDELLVFNALGPYPVHIDDLARKTSIEPGKLSGILLTLELKGSIQQSPGKFFSKEVKNNGL